MGFYGAIAENSSEQPVMKEVGRSRFVVLSTLFGLEPMMIVGVQCFLDKSAKLTL